MSSHLLQKQQWTSGSTLQRRPLRYLLYPRMQGCSPSLSEQSGTWPFVAADLDEYSLRLSLYSYKQQKGKIWELLLYGGCQKHSLSNVFSPPLRWIARCIVYYGFWMWSRARGGPNLETCLAVILSRFQKSFCAKEHMDRMWLRERKC